jgi:murein DD-endopeptidase MepM/ murein hydrolase activator NlpD
MPAFQVSASGYNPGGQFNPISGFGTRTGPDGSHKTHEGQDFAAPTGTLIPAAAAGTVVWSGFNSSYGNTVIVESVNSSGSNFFALYAHMTGNTQAQVGEAVWAGKAIGEVGNTGANSRGSHVHFEYLYGGTPVSIGGTGGSLGFSGLAWRKDPASVTDWGVEGVYHASTWGTPSTGASTVIDAFGNVNQEIDTYGPGYYYEHLILNGSDSWDVTGVGAVITGDSDSVYLAPGATATVSGTDNDVYNYQGGVVTIQGNNNNVVADNISTVKINGGHNNADLWGSQMSLWSNGYHMTYDPYNPFTILPKIYSMAIIRCYRMVVLRANFDHPFSRKLRAGRMPS